MSVVKFIKNDTNAMRVKVWREIEGCNSFQHTAVFIYGYRDMADESRFASLSELTYEQGIIGRWLAMKNLPTDLTNQRDDIGMEDKLVLMVADCVLAALQADEVPDMPASFNWSFV